VAYELVISDLFSLLSNNSSTGYLKSDFCFDSFKLVFSHNIPDCAGDEFMTPNVRAKRATAAWRAGQQAQNGAKPQRLMASAPRRWRSA